MTKNEGHNIQSPTTMNVLYIYYRQATGKGPAMEGTTDNGKISSPR